MSGQSAVRVVLAVFLAITVLLPGCDDSPTTPDPVQPPPGIPNAKMFDNLPLVRQLESQLRPDTILTRMSGTFDQAGTCRDGNAVEYVFTRISTGEHFDWWVYSDGQLEVYGPMSPVGPITIVDIGPMMKLNSDETARLSRKYGGQRFVALYPDSLSVQRYSIIDDYPVCKVHLHKIGVPCEPSYWIDAGTGELLQKDDDCIPDDMPARS